MICLLPSRTFARTASMILSFGRSICGFRSGTQNLQRRPQPVVISTTPNVVRVSGNSDRVAFLWVNDGYFLRQVFAGDRLCKKIERVLRFAAALDDAVDAELVVHDRSG